MKNYVFWYVAPYRYYVNRHFGGTYRLYLQGVKIRERVTSVSLQPPAQAGSLLADFLHLEDGCDTFLRNVGLHNIYTAPHPQKCILHY
jgi:hypothetical protein